MKITTKIGPFTKSRDNTSKVMIRLVISLVIISLFAFFKNGIIPFTKGSASVLEMFYPLIFIIIPTICTFLFETLYCFIFLKQRGSKLLYEVKTNYAFVPGIFIGLILPLNTPIYLLIFACLVAVISKMIFGGFSKNIFNPALVGVLIITLFFGGMIGTRGGYLNPYEIDTKAGPTPLTNVVTVDGIGSYDELVKPYGMSNLIVGNIPGGLGEVSTVLIVLCFIFLSVTKTIKSRISLTYVGLVFILTYLVGLFGGLGFLDLWYPIFYTITGGLLFGAVFMAVDPVTSPTGKYTQYLFAVILAVLTVFFRFFTSFPEGVMLSILIANVFVRPLDNLFAISLKKGVKALIIIVVLIIGFGVSLLAGSSRKIEEVPVKPGEPEDKNFKIISKEVVLDDTVYIVSQKGYVSLIEFKIVIRDSVVLEVEVVKQSETYFELILENDYLDEFNGLDSANAIDTISGATVTSSAIKKAINNTFDDYNKSK